jgi:hypothetical protein
MKNTENDPHEKTILKKCDVCGRAVLVDQFGGGECSYCTWYQIEYNVEHPDDFCFTNIISLNRARQLYKEGKQFIPNFDEFLEGLRLYKEMEFQFKSIRYGVTFGYVVALGKATVEFFVCEPFKKLQTFGSFDEFKTKAHLGGLLLGDIWGKVERAGFLE